MPKDYNVNENENNFLLNSRNINDSKNLDGFVKKILIGTLADDPIFTVERNKINDEKQYFMKLSILQEGGRNPIITHFKTVIYSDDKIIDKVFKDLSSLKKNDTITAAGNWFKGRQDKWNFSAARIAKDFVPISEFQSHNLSSKVLAEIPIDVNQASIESSNSLSSSKSFSVDENTPVKLSASMYFKYDNDKRPGLESNSTFDAILDGERVSTTRFDKYEYNNKWKNLIEGDLVRFYEDKEMKGRSVVVAIKSVSNIDLEKLGNREIDEWSKREGWSVEAGRKFGRNGPGTNILYKPVPDQAILIGRREASIDIEHPLGKSKFDHDVLDTSKKRLPNLGLNRGIDFSRGF